MAVVPSEPDWSHLGRWEAPGPGRTVEPAAALTTELTEFWGLVWSCCACSRSRAAASRADLGLFDTCFQTTGQLTGSWIASLAAALKQQIATHTSVTEQRAAYAAAPAATGTEPEAIHSIPYLHDLNHIWKSLASFHLFIWLQMNAVQLNASFLNKQTCPARVRCFCCGTSHASFMEEKTCKITNVFFVCFFFVY